MAEPRRIEAQPGPQSRFLASKADIAIYGGAAGGGKALRLDEPIATPDGWRAVGELVVGSMVFDEAGRPTVVTAVHEVMLPHVAYRLTFDDGGSIECNADHLWLTYDATEMARLTRSGPEWMARRRASRPSRASGKKSDRFSVALAARNSTRAAMALPRPPPAGSVRSTAEIAASVRTSSGRTNHAVPMNGSLALPEVAFELDPYLLGVWLGDGTTVRGEITSADPEIPKAFAEAGYDVRPRRSNYGYGIRGLQSHLRRVGVLGNKHVPRPYLRASERQRRALLEGLMDTDGHACTDGACEFTTTSPALRDGMYELLWSLGVKAAVCEGVATLNGRAIGPKWRFKFTAPWFAFRLERKRSVQRLASRRTTRFRYIVSIEEVPSTPMRCITVANASGLFLAGRSMVVTHNSYALLLEPLYHIDNGKFGGVIFRRTSPQLTGIGSLWDDAQELYRPLGAAMRESPTLSASFPSGATLQFLHLQHASDVYDHQGKQYAFIGFDELTHFEASQFWYLVSRLRSTSGVRPYLRATTNPDPDSFVRKLIGWWIDDDGVAIPERAGVLRWFVRDGDSLVWGDTREELLKQCSDGDEPLSITFIAARLEDNPALIAKDPGYRARLKSLPEVERQRLLGANWDVRPEGGKYIERAYFVRRWSNPLPLLNVYICSDYAVTEPLPGKDPDWTEHGVFGISSDDEIFVLDWWNGQTKSDVWIEVLLDKVARWKPACVFGEAGVIQKSMEPLLVKRMRERHVYARTEWLSTATGRSSQGSSKQGFEDRSKQAKAIRGRAFQARAAQGRILFPADAEWADRVMDQCVGFPNGKDDAFDVMSHMCLAIDQAHAAIARKAPKPPKRSDYDREAKRSDSWKVV